MVSQAPIIPVVPTLQMGKAFVLESSFAILRHKNGDKMVPAHALNSTLMISDSLFAETSIRFWVKGMKLDTWYRRKLQRI